MAPRTKADNQKIQEQTRQKIIIAALQLFAEKGYTSCSVSQIAKEAGISKGLIYHYFSSKEDVLQGIFEMLVKKGENIFDQWEGHTPKEKLRITITESIAVIKRQTQVMRFMASLALQPDATKDLKQISDAKRKEMMMLYQQIFADLGYQDPEAEAYFTGALLDGVLLGYVSVDDYPIDKIEHILLNRYNL